MKTYFCRPLSIYTHTVTTSPRPFPIEYLETMLRCQALLSVWLLMLGYSTGLVAVDWTAITDGHGNHLPDFSFAGYHSSDLPLPSSISLLVTLNAASGDQTARIQAALDQASAAGGGAVMLGKGNFQISSGLNVSSKVVLRGSGVSSTKFILSKIPNGRPVFNMGNGTNSQIKPSLSSTITNAFVGIGSSVVTINNPLGFHPGQVVFVNRAATAKWIRGNGMADLVRDGKPQTWIGVCIWSAACSWERFLLRTVLTFTSHRSAHLFNSLE